MSTLSLLMSGFAQCFTWERMIACVAGVLVGTLTGVLPGIGVTGAMALLLPISFGMDATTALILFAGFYPLASGATVPRAWGEAMNWFGNWMYY